MIKRHRYLVNKPVQLRYLALVLFPLVILLSALYYLIYYSVFTQMLIPEAVSTTLLPAMRRVNLAVVLFAPVILFLLLRTALIYSNRTIGPLPRLEKELDKVVAGDCSLRLKTRDKDDLKSFVNKINQLIEKIDNSRRV